MEVVAIITLTDILAIWGALVATIVLLWDIYKWKTSGARVIFHAKPNMKISENIGDCPKDKTYVHMEAVNNGDQPTTVTKTTCFYYKSWIDRLLRKPTSQYYIKPGGDPLPYVLEPGKIWNGLANQDGFDELLGNGVLLFALDLSHKKKPQRCRVRIAAK